MVTWHKHYILLIAVHIFEVAIVGSATAMIKLIKPAYDTMDVLIIIAVGMIAGAIYLLSMNRIEK